jgi:hypothetical protein
MHSHQLTAGRTLGVRFDPGEIFVPALEDLCRSYGIRCGYIPMFLAAFAEADIVGTCDKLDDPAAQSGPGSTSCRHRIGEGQFTTQVAASI